MKSLKQIDRWVADHYLVTTGDEWGDSGFFVDARKRVKQLRDRVESLYQAMQDPFAPGAAAIISAGDVAWKDHDLTDDGWGATICCMGEALQWGLAGADLVALKLKAAESDKAVAADEAAAELERQRQWTPEKVHAFGLRLANEAIADIAAVAVKGNASRMDLVIPAGPLTVDEKRAIVERLQVALGLVEDRQAVAQ